MSLARINDAPVVLNYDARKFVSGNFYVCSLKQDEVITEYKVPHVSSPPDLFMKLLFSDYEVEAYRKLEGLSVTPKMIGVTENALGKYIILERMERWDAEKFRANHEHYLDRIVEKFKLMSEMEVVHGDIKSDNLLMKDGDVFFCDIEDKGCSSKWASPEVRDGSNPTTSSDTYSLGCLIVELLDDSYESECEEDFSYSENLDNISNFTKYHKLARSCIFEGCVSE